MSDGGGRILALVRRLRGQLEQLGNARPLELSEVLRSVDQVERGVALLERVAVDSFSEFEGRIRDLSMLRRLSDVVVSVFDLDRLCESFLEIAREGIPCAAAAVHLVGGSPVRLECRAGRGAWEDESGRALADRCAEQAAGGTGTLHLDDAWADPALEALAREAGQRALLACPIATLGRPLGAIQLADPRPAKFRRDDRRALEALADLAGLAVRHLQLSGALAHGEEFERALRAPGPALYGTRLALVRRDKLSSLAKLAASIAHELNNPMSYVLSNLERAQEYVDELEHSIPADSTDRANPAAFETRALLEDFRALIAETASGLERVRRVAYELHGMGRGTSEGLEPVDLNALLAAALDMVRDEAKPGVRFESRAKPIPAVPCRSLQILQVLFHLLVNAVEAVGEAGTIRASTQRAGNWVRVEIADDGPGVPPERWDRIFEPFYSTKPGDGAGLGLAISREIVKAHRGSLRVAGDDGAVFTMSLPIAWSSS